MRINRKSDTKEKMYQSAVDEAHIKIHAREEKREEGETVKELIRKRTRAKARKKERREQNESNDAREKEREKEWRSVCERVRKREKSDDTKRDRKEKLKGGRERERKKRGLARARKSSSERQRPPKTPFEKEERGPHGRRIYEGRDDERTRGRRESRRRRGGTRNGFENTYAVAVVEAGRSWPALIRHLMLEGGVPGAPRPARRLSLLVAPVVHPPRPGLRLSHSLSCHRPGPDASATTGRRIVIVSEIGDPADSDRHRRPPFPFFLSFLFPLATSLAPSPSSALSNRRSLSFLVPPLSLPPFKSSAKAKGSSFTLARGIMLTRSYHALSLFISFSLANRPFGTHSIAAVSRSRR